MIRLTERYSVENLEPLCDGWRMGNGHDARLERPVVVLSVSLSAVDRTEFDAWLAKRVAVSHPYISELLDGAALDGNFLCIFEGAGGARAGLPDMPRQELLLACLSVLQSVESLHANGVGFHFSAGQVLWDGREPRVLGLLPADGKQADGSQSMLARNVGLYFGHLCQWNMGVAQGETASQVSPLFRMGLEKLLGQGNGGCTSFAEVNTALQAMLMEDGFIPGAAAGKGAGGARPLAAGHPSSLSGEESRHTRFDDARVKRSPASVEMGAGVVRNAGGGELAAEEAWRDRKERGDQGNWNDRNDQDGQDDQDDWEDDQDESSGTLRRSLVAGALIVGAALLGIAAVNLWNALARSTVAAGSTPGQSAAASQQTPTSGSGGKAGGSAHTTGGSQPQSGTIPQVAGMTPQSAIRQLVAAGISATRVEVEAGGGSGAAGRVIATLPTAGSALQHGQTVMLRVDVPAGQQLVPNLVGLPLQTAENTLLQDKYHFAYIDHSKSGATLGTVYSQTPLPYSVAAPWTTVHFIVASHY